MDLEMIGIPGPVTLAQGAGAEVQAVGGLSAAGKFNFRNPLADRALRKHSAYAPGRST
jgi:hypothetical protein